MNRIRLGLFVMVSLLALGLGVFLVSGDARAQEPPDDPLGELVATATVDMVADCSNRGVGASALRSIFSGRDPCRGAGGGMAKSTVYGDCGSLTLNLYDDGGGWLQYQVIITSTMGPLFSAAYGGVAHNLHTGGGHYASGSDSFIFSSSWQDDEPPYTGRGVIFGETLWAESATITGQSCQAAGTAVDVVFVTD